MWGGGVAGSLPGRVSSGGRYSRRHLAAGHRSGVQTWNGPIFKPQRADVERRRRRASAHKRQAVWPHYSRGHHVTLACFYPAVQPQVLMNKEGLLLDSRPTHVSRLC